jgi:GR25 family glycosyltransferase involved in LPS biosynthesis
MAAPLKIGVSTFFQYSFFSNGLGTVALSLAAALEALGHTIILINTNGKSGWYDDCEGLKDRYERRNIIEWSGEPLDIFIDIDGYIVPDKRRQIAKTVVVFIRKPTALFECEHTVYPVVGPIRNLRDCDALWTWDLFGAQDAHLLELLSERPVFRVPFTWSAAAIESIGFSQPAWLEISKHSGAAGNPWACHIAETNQSTVSNATLPVVSMAYAKTHNRMKLESYFVHNSQMLEKQQFFLDNVYSHCKRDGLEAHFVGRQRVTDWRGLAKSFVLSHTRFITVRGMHLDCVWNGIPLVHNSPWLRDLGCSLERYYYSDNSVKGAAEAMQRMADDFGAGMGMFAQGALERVREALKKALDPCKEESKGVWEAAISGKKGGIPMAPVTTVTSVTSPVTSVVSSSQEENVLTIGFSDLWDSANHDYNFWTLLLQDACNKLKTPLKVRGVKISDANLQDRVDVLFFGPFGDVWTRVGASVPKVHITGENTPSKPGPGVYLNLGFEATDLSRGVYRFPLWIQYIDWFGADQDRLVNPKSMPLEYMACVDPALLDRKSKFCAFIVSNPNNHVRNQAFLALNDYKRVDSAGRLFNNIGDAVFTDIPGGGGGELKKLEFLKDYKFSLTYENSKGAGYVTEKILAAKAAGCVPIYWGAPDVVEDFPAGSFINANNFETSNDLIAAVKEIDEDDAKWKAMASIPAISLEKERRRLDEVASLILGPILGGGVGKVVEGEVAEDVKVGIPFRFEEKTVEYLTEPSKEVVWNGKTLLVTYATQKFVQSLVNWLASAEMQKKARSGIQIRAYLGDDIDVKAMNVLRAQHPDVEFKRLPTKDVTVEKFPDLWSAEHFAWKIWIYQELVRDAGLEGHLVWYSDCGSVIVRWPEEWLQGACGSGLCMLEDREQTNGQWCHDAFCEALDVTDAEKAAQQIVGGIVSFVGGSALGWQVFVEAWKWAQMREVIVGPKWSGIRGDGRPYGHRHDQSILSILRLRFGVPVYPLEKVYCHESLRRTYKSGCALYVHRGTMKEHENFAPRIGEVHLINLARRCDRIQRFKEMHEDWTKMVCLRPAYDGRKLELTPELARIFAPNDFFWKKAVMGCALSHLSLWLELANEKLCVENYLILEDDVKFQRGWLEHWREAAKHIPEDYDVLYLGGVLPPNKAMYHKVVEPVNPFWGRVAMNQIFGQTELTRYFHFCNYSYILSRRGAQKILEEMQRRGGYYTSADHMICNRVQDMVHYVLIPPVAGCYQDDDPKYVGSEFNNFSRVDGFDSDLWNNDERWSGEEIQRVFEKSSESINIGQVLFQQTNATLAATVATREVAGNPAPIAAAASKRFFTVGEHTFHMTAQLEFSWLRELLGPHMNTVETIPIDHEPMDCIPVFLCAKPHLEDYMRVFTMYEATGKDFIVVHLSDEYCNDPLHFYTFERCKQIIRMYPRLTVPCPEKVLTIPLGPYRRKRGTDETPRSLVWSFVGTGWKGRDKALEPLKGLEPHKTIFYKDWMDPDQLTADQYSNLCGQSIFMACPGGQNPETFRFWESLEFGCIPLYVRRAGDEAFYAFLSKELPLISFSTWEQAAGFMKSLMENPASLVQYRKTILEKWSGWKQKLQEQCAQIIA